MLDDLNELKTFRAILAEGSLSAAARRMGVTLAVVSKRLATLENRASVRLIHRNTRDAQSDRGGRAPAHRYRAGAGRHRSERAMACRRPQRAGRHAASECADLFWAAVYSARARAACPCAIRGWPSRWSWTIGW